MAKEKKSQQEIEQELLEKQREIPQLRAKLTKKNEDFMYKFDKEMATKDYTGNETLLYYFMLSELVEGQKTGKTAQQLYQTPKIWAEHVVERPLDANENLRSPFWQLALDGGLFMGGLYSLIAGVTGLISPGQSTGLGLITLIINFILGGIALAVLGYYQPNPDAPKGERGFKKYFIAAVLAIVLWFGVLSIVAFLLPPAWNISLSPGGYLIIGAVALLARWYFKKSFNIRGGLFN